VCPTPVQPNSFQLVGQDPEIPYLDIAADNFFAPWAKDDKNDGDVAVSVSQLLSGGDVTPAAATKIQQAVTNDPNRDAIFAVPLKDGGVLIAMAPKTARQLDAVTKDPVVIYKVNTATGAVEPLPIKESKISQVQGHAGSGAGVSGFSATLMNGTVISGRESHDGKKQGFMTTQAPGKEKSNEQALAIYGCLGEDNVIYDRGFGLNRGPSH
jgi:hypothetical protein